MSKKITPEWAEDLPEDCPPNEAYSPNGEFFRLVNQVPPLELDFDSHRKLFPHKAFHTDECRTRSTSIFSDLESCLNLKKLPIHRGKQIVKIKLTPKSGVILQTGQTKFHFSWWRSKTYFSAIKWELFS